MRWLKNENIKTRIETEDGRKLILLTGKNNKDSRKRKNGGTIDLQHLRLQVSDKSAVLQSVSTLIYTSHREYFKLEMHEGLNRQ